MSVNEVARSRAYTGSEHAIEDESLAGIAASIGQHSELINTARQVGKRRDNILGLLLRSLSKEEIALLESRACYADDWSLIQVAQDFDAFRVKRVYFRGRCVLGRFSGEVEVMPGLNLACGLYDCTLVECQIGNDCLIEKVRFAAHIVVERGAVLFDIGAITCAPDAHFACGHPLPLGCETGGREVPIWAEMTVDSAAAVARDRQDRAGLAAVGQAVNTYVRSIASPVGWVRRGAHVRHSERIRNAWIGAGAEIDHVLELSDVAILSSAEEPVKISGGASVTSSVLQWGVTIAGNAILRHTVMLEHSSADDHATIENSVIGPNTAVAKGEITASLVGPFVGFHHQSLLISAFWPQGKGNIAYGAMVGSNHTSRAPDQECWPGEGTFFGLGCAIRFPTDFSDSPYLTVGLGTTTLPQRVRFPFSLITIPSEALGGADDEVPRAYNELIPAWGLEQNAYGLVRTELKLAKRDRARRHRIDYKVLRPSIIRLVRDACSRLEAVAVVKPVYLENDIDGLGKNFLRDTVRVQAIEQYRRALLRYGLRILLNEAEKRLEIPGSAEVGHELVAALAPGGTFAQHMQRLVAVERDNAERVEASKAQDDQRGVRIIPGYADAHVAAAQDPVVRSAWDRVARTEARIRALGVHI